MLKGVGLKFYLLLLLTTIVGCGGATKNKILPEGERLSVFTLEQPKLDTKKGWSFKASTASVVSSPAYIAGDQPDYLYNLQGNMPDYNKLKMLGKFASPLPEDTSFVVTNNQLCYLAKFNNISCLALETGKVSNINFSVLSSHYHPRDYKGGGISLVKGNKFVVTNGSNLIYSINQDGSTAWTAQLPAILQEPPYIVDGGLVLVSTVENQFFALDATSGALVWANESPKGDLASPNRNNILAFPAHGANPNSAIWVNSGGEVARVNLATGEKMWSNNLLYNYEMLPGTSLNYLTLGRAFSNDIIFLHDNEGNIYALNADNGQKLWQFYFGAISSWWITDKELLLVSKGGQFIALNAKDGKLLANANIAEGNLLQSKKSLMVVVDGKLYLLGGKLRWLEGKEWRSMGDNKKISPIAVIAAPNKKESLYIITSDGVYN